MATTGNLSLFMELAATPYTHLQRVAATQLSEVHIVEHRALGHRAIMKLLARAEDEHTRAEMTQRLLREGRVLKGLRHENIVEVHDFGFTCEDRAYLVVELLSGSDLKKEVLGRGPLPSAEVVEIGRQVLRGLEYAHQAGVVHRDLKPENLMRLEADAEGHRRVKILDFGIAKIVHQGARDKIGGAMLTAPGAIIGTPRYTSPEQILGEHVDARSDLYALGGVLFYLLTGRAPFLGADITELLKAQLESCPVPPSRLQRGISPLLDEVVLRALSKAPQDRYACADDMLTELEIAARSAAATSAQTVRLEDLATQPIPKGTLGSLVAESGSRRASVRPFTGKPDETPRREHWGRGRGGGGTGGTAGVASGAEAGAGRADSEIAIDPRQTRRRHSQESDPVEAMARPKTAATARRVLWRSVILSEPRLMSAQPRSQAFLL